MNLLQIKFIETNENILFLNSDGDVCKIPKNKFHHGEIVKTNENHYTKDNFVMLVEPTYNKIRGWIYGKRFINRQGSYGGYSYWAEESHFTKIDDARDILFAKRIKIKTKINDLETEIDNLKSELGKIEYGLDSTTPNWDKIERDCHGCGKLFYGHGIGGNYNNNLCCDCDLKWGN